MLCGFQYVKDACHKTLHPSVAEGFPYTLPTSAYPSAFPKAFACFDRLNTSLGQSLPFGLAVGCLLTPLSSPLTGGTEGGKSLKRVTLFRISISRDFRTVLRGAAGSRSE